jgi:hypothetical protein
MTKKRGLMLVGLVVLALLVVCRGSEGHPDTVATKVAAGVTSTLTAEAARPVFTLVVTPSPAVEPTASMAPTAPPTSKVSVVTRVKIHIEADGSSDYPCLEAALLAAP